MEDYRQTRKEYRRLQKEILEKRAAKAGELVRGVMERMERAPSPIRKARPQPTEQAHHLRGFRTAD